MKKECKLIKNNLSDYIDNELTYTEKDMMENHLKKCKSCAQELNLLFNASKIMKKLKRISVSEMEIRKLKARIRNEAIDELLNKSNPDYEKYFNTARKKISHSKSLTMENLAEDGKKKTSKLLTMKEKLTELFSFYLNKKRIIYPILACAVIIAITTFLLDRKNNIPPVETKHVAALTDKQSLKQKGKNSKMYEVKSEAKQRIQMPKSDNEIIPKEEVLLNSQLKTKDANEKKVLEPQAGQSLINLESEADKPKTLLAPSSAEKLKSEKYEQEKIITKPKSIEKYKADIKERREMPVVTEDRVLSYERSSKENKIVKLPKRKLFLNIPNKNSSIESVNILIEARKDIENKTVNLNLVTNINNEELEKTILDTLKQYDWYSFFLDEEIKTNKCILIYKLHYNTLELLEIR